MDARALLDAVLRRAARPRWLVAGVFVAGFLLTLGTLEARSLRAGDSFDLVRWEISTLPNKWTYKIGAPLRDDPDHDEAIALYFALDPASRANVDRLENAVEAAVEGRVDAVLQELGLGGPVRLPGSVFPPVNIELAASPRVMIASPRDRIERALESLLRPDLSLGGIVALEDEHERRHPDHAALVVGAGGVATYPAVVSNAGTYRQIVSTAAHEWAHHYLAFYPLGFRYFTSGDLRAINETVADIVGDEVARIVIERWGDPTAGGAPPAPRPLPAVDVSAELRNLRLAVDELLSEGRVEDAEVHMEAVRQQLERAGYPIRRINQAYFAWFGTYAARPDSVDPLGPQLFEIRVRAGSLQAFLEEIRGVGSRADVEAILDRLREEGAAAG